MIMIIIYMYILHVHVYIYMYRLIHWLIYIYILYVFYICTDTASIVLSDCQYFANRKENDSHQALFVSSLSLDLHMFNHWYWALLFIIYNLYL